jgi:hypothetical protein
MIAKGRAYPPKPRNAWRELANTRWPHQIDVVAFSSEPELDIKYERIIPDAFNRIQLEDWSDEVRNQRAEEHEELKELRASVRDDDGND